MTDLSEQQREMVGALEKCLALIDDMSRFVGKMALQDYALFNEAPMAARAALRKHRKAPTPEPKP